MDFFLKINLWNYSYKFQYGIFLWNFIHKYIYIYNQKQYQIS